MPAIDGRVALVTGAGRGIGRLIATWLAAAGARVIACARSEGDLARLAADLTAIGAEFLVRPCDVRDSVAVYALVRDALDRFGAVDIAVANAGVLGPLGPIDASDASEWNEVLAVNVAGTAAVMRAVLPTMRARGYGRIVTLSGAGIGGPQTLTNVSAYVASKAAVVALTEAVARELPPGLTANALAPGMIATGFMDSVREAGPELAGAALFAAADATPTVDLEPLRALVLYLVSDESGSLTGRCVSARWDSVATLRALDAADLTEDRFRLRRIDGDLYPSSIASVQ